MKKLNMILGLILIVCGVLYATADEKPYRFVRLEADTYDLNLSLSTVANRLYANCTFTIASSELPEADYYSFFIHKRAYLEKVKVNGKFVPYHYTKDLDPRLFEPEFKHCELLDNDTPVYCISIAKEDLAELKGELSFSLDYRMLLPAPEKDDTGQEFFSWDTEEYIYPKNPDKAATLRISFLSTLYYKMENADGEKLEGNLRTSRREVYDEPGKSQEIKLYSVR